MAEGGDLDFDPIGEGKIDINDFGDDELEPLFVKPKESIKTWWARFRKYFSKKGITLDDDRLLDYKRLRGETIDDWSNKVRANVREEIPLERLRKKGEAENVIKSRFPNWNPKESAFFFTIDEYGQAIVRLRYKGAKVYALDDYGSLPNTIKENLGKSRAEIEENNEIWDKINGLFPENKIDESFNFRYNAGVMEITHDTGKNWQKMFNKNGEVNGNLQKVIKDALGDTADVIQARNDDMISENESEISELSERKDLIEDNIEYLTEKTNVNELRERKVVIERRIRDSESSITTMDDEDRLDAARVILETSRNELIEVERQIESADKHIESAGKRLEDRAREHAEVKDLSNVIETSNDALREVLAKQRLEENRLQEQIREKEQENEQLRERNEAIEEHKPLKQRIKDIFKKYGFTVTAVVTAVGVIIGVIIKSLTSGLATVAKGVGNGLKTIGKKLGQILPGMVGAIASFIFRTAGEVVGFLAKNAWLLIVAVVLYFVERYKKKR
jgi:hypothetical protein